MEEPTTVLDCYDFPAAFKTHHLHDIFREYENMRGGYRIKWLEDTRALIMFEHPSTGKIDVNYLWRWDGVIDFLFFWSWLLAKKAYIDNVSNPLAKIRPYSGPMNVLRCKSLMSDSHCARPFCMKAHTLPWTSYISEPCTPPTTYYRHGGKKVGSWRSWSAGSHTIKGAATGGKRSIEVGKR